VVRVFEVVAVRAHGRLDRFALGGLHRLAELLVLAIVSQVGRAGLRNDTAITGFAEMLT
jgi:hypothetical protein